MTGAGSEAEAEAEAGVASEAGAGVGVASGAGAGVASGADGQPRARPRRGAPGARRPSYDAPSLVEVAVAEFIAQGYEATSMEDLSRAAGITKSSFYNHVSGKEALLRAALERALDGLFAVLDEPAAREGSPLQRLRHIVARQVEVLVAELPYVTLLLRVRGNTETERWALDRRRAFDAAVATLVRAAVEQGQVRADVEPALAARLLSGMVNSIVEWYRPGRSRPEALREEIVRIVFDGILPRATTMST